THTAPYNRTHRFCFVGTGIWTVRKGKRAVEDVAKRRTVVNDSTADCQSREVTEPRREQPLRILSSVGFTFVGQGLGPAAKNETTQIFICAKTIRSYQIL
ncbi:MAG: hypothetical protein IJY33_04680, partial [Oscillospiraceae bacterium]|nr:hypothetical protein [Oscillospiraceae bacterium]